MVEKKKKEKEKWKNRRGGKGRKKKREGRESAVEMRREINIYVLSRQGLHDGELLLVRIRHAQVEHLVEPSGPEQGRVEQVRSVGGADDEDTAAGVVPPRHAVELGQQL